MAGIRTARRMAILFDVQDHASAQLAGLNGLAMKASNSFGGAADSANAMGKALAGAAVAAGLGAVALSRMVSIGGQLDRTFAIVQEAASATDEEMVQITDTTRQLAAELPVTLDEVSRAFEQFTYAGYSATEAVEAADGAVRLAVAGQMDMADAVQTTVSIINAYNLEAEQADYITSALAATFANSAIEIDEIGSAMQYASAQMSQLGFDAGETAASIGVMADQGMRGTMAGTALNQAMSQLASGTGKTNDALQAAGLSIQDFTDEEGNMKPMSEILTIINQALDDVNATGQETARWLHDVFGQRGARAMGPLLDNVDDFVDKMQDQALATVKDFMHELDKAGEARLALIMESDDPEQMDEDLEGMSDEAIIQWAAQEDIDLGEIESGMDIIEQMRDQRDEMDEGEMAEKLATMFQMEDEAAAELSSMIQDTSNDLEDLEEAYDEATGGAELSAAAMDNVAGQLEYLRSSFQAIMYTMYTGFRPLIMALLDILIVFADVINRNERVLQALGLALFVVTTYLGSIAIALTAAWISQTKFAGAVVWSTKALWAHVFSLGSATKAAYAKLLATKSLNAATSTFIITLWKSTSATLRSTAAKYLAATSEVTFAGAVKYATAAVWGKVAAFAALHKVMLPFLAIILLIGAIVLAYQRDWYGFASVVDAAVARIRDAIDWLSDTIGRLIDWFQRLSGIMKVVLALSLYLVSPWLAVAAVIALVVYWFLDLIGVFDYLEEKGLRIDGVLGTIASVLGMVGRAIAFVIELIAALIRGIVEMIASLGAMIEAFDKVMMGFLGNIIGGIVTFAKRMATLEQLVLSVIMIFFPWLRVAITLYKVLYGFGVLPSIFGTIQKVIGHIVDFFSNWRDVAKALLMAMFPMIGVFLGLYKVLDRMDFAPLVFEMITRELSSMYERAVEVWETLEYIWDLLRNIAFSPFDLDIDIDLSGIPTFSDIIGYFKDEDGRTLAKRFQEDVIGDEWGIDLPDGEQIREDIQEFLSSLPDGDEMREITHGWATDFMDALFDHEFWKAQLPAWLQTLIDFWYDIRGSREDGDDSTMGDRARGWTQDKVEGLMPWSRGGEEEPATAQTGSYIQTASDTSSAANDLSTAATSLNHATGSGRGRSATDVSRGIEYVDQRQVNVSQDPTINIDVDGSDVSTGRMQNQIEKALEGMRHQALEDFIDFLTLGGPEAFDGGFGGDPGSSGEPGEEGEDGMDPGEDTTEDDIEGDPGPGGDDENGEETDDDDSNGAPPDNGDFV